MRDSAVQAAAFCVLRQRVIDAILPRHLVATRFLDASATTRDVVVRVRVIIAFVGVGVVLASIIAVVLASIIAVVLASIIAVVLASIIAVRVVLPLPTTRRPPRSVGMPTVTRDVLRHVPVTRGVHRPRPRLRQYDGITSRRRGDVDELGYHDDLWLTLRTVSRSGHTGRWCR
jgi:hypothetical protein